MRKNFYNLNRNQLNKYLEENFESAKKYHSNEIFKWVYKRKISNFNEISNLSQKLRLFLNQNIALELNSLELLQKDEIDGTIKLKILLKDGYKIESVIIPTEKRRTLCISSQVGCKRGCSFCCTSTMGYRRNLSTAEIISQVLISEEVVKKKFNINIKKDQHLITNIVFMGMGEPLDNLVQVGNAILILVDQMGFAYSKRRITVSTCGIAEKILKIPQYGDPNLAISLNATNDITRNILMPINKKTNLEKLFNVLKKYPLERGRRITFEYVLIHGINDSIEDANNLLKLISKVPSKLNLICFNKFEGSKYIRPCNEKILSFSKFMQDHGVQTNLRESKGNNISAACGQLVS